ncbi:MAG: hypothetical protein NVS2B16_13980 [Chloroflexota bacterium]
MTMSALSFPDSSLGYEQLFCQLVDQTHVGMLVIGSRRRVLVVNAAARSMLAFEGDVPCLLAAVVRDIEVEFAVGDALHDRKSVRYETYAPHPDRLLQYEVNPIVAATGEPVLAIVSIQDVTRLRHLETVRRDFVANVSHELRTPITSINLLVETLQNGAMDDREAADHFLQRIEVETLSMMRLVEELLELSRLESGRLALQLDVMHARDVLHRVAERLAVAALDKGIELHVDVQEPLPAVLADAERMEQVLMNLVHNAIKFTPENGTVTLRASRHGRGVQIDVIDTGVGMDPGEAARVFERFYKVDKGRNRAAGIGLGLAVARHIIELHGSRLHVVSAPGRGSRFSFDIPIAG